MNVLFIKQVLGFTWDFTGNLGAVYFIVYQSHAINVWFGMNEIVENDKKLFNTFSFSGILRKRSAYVPKISLISRISLSTPTCALPWVSHAIFLVHVYEPDGVGEMNESIQLSVANDSGNNIFASKWNGWTADQFFLAFSWSSPKYWIPVTFEISWFILFLGDSSSQYPPELYAAYIVPFPKECLNTVTEP